MHDIAGYKSVIFSGCSIEARGVSVCNLEDFMMGQFVPRAKYQVWSDRHKFYRLYHNVDDAVEKFLELRRKK